MRHCLTAGCFIVGAMLTSSTPAFAQFVQQGSKLVGSGSVNSPRQGSDVAISSDGNTAIVGGWDDDFAGAGGAVWFFTRSGGTWTQQGPKVPAPEPTHSFGHRVALSADGNTAAIADGVAVWIFVRSGSTWTPQGPKLVGTGVVGVFQVSAVAMSADGNTVLVGNYVDNDFIGATWVFTRSGSTWTQQGPKLVGTPAVRAFSGQGYSVALSADGNTALVGSPGDGGNQGAVWVFTRSGGTWTQQGETLTATGGSGSPGFGYRVALSGDGMTAAMGGPGDASNVGAVWIFTRSGSSWTQQGSKLVGTGSTGMALQGGDLSLSSNGNTLFVGGSHDGYVPDPNDSSGSLFPVTGGTWVFRRAGGVWSQSGGKIMGTGAVGISYSYSDHQGAVSISGDGLTAIVGNPGDQPLGAVWIFTQANDLQRAGDRDRDGRSEITVYNSASGMWSSLTSTSGYADATNVGWGGTGYSAAPGDYDGDGRTDLGLYVVSTGYWYVLLSGSNFTTALSKSAGGPGWQAVPADYDGDGKTDFGVYNFITGQWWGLTSSTNYTPTINRSWGGSSYGPVAADYDGDGKADFGVYNQGTGLWAILLSSTNYTTSLAAFCGGDAWSPVPADYDGDGRADMVLYNSNNGQWYGLKSSGHYETTLNITWGGLNYKPVKGDYDGDGKADLAVYVEATGAWYILLSGANYTTALSRNWGGTGYLAVPRFP
jgi:hypothetical protein